MQERERGREKDNQKNTNKKKNNINEYKELKVRMHENA